MSDPQRAGPTATKKSASFFDQYSGDHRKPLGTEEWDKCRMEIYAHNEAEFVDTATRNILLCGRSRSGKTTTMGVLKDPCFTPDQNSIFSDTQNPKFQTFSINNCLTEKVERFTLNFVDTPGLFEVKDVDNVDKERSNEIIASTIAKCLENEITNIHAIIMFATFETGVNPNDIEAMKLFLQMFGGSGVSVALCITHADKHGHSWREDIRDQLMRHKELKLLIEQEKMSILFMGCVNKADRNYYDTESLRADYVSVYRMRQQMLDFIFQADEKRMLNQMNVARQKVEAVESAMDVIIANMIEFATCRDLKTSPIQERMINHKANMEWLSHNQVYITVPQLADKFPVLLDAARKLKGRDDIDEELKQTLIWPLNLR